MNNRGHTGKMSENTITFKKNRPEWKQRQQQVAEKIRTNSSNQRLRSHRSQSSISWNTQQKQKQKKS